MDGLHQGGVRLSRPGTLATPGIEFFGGVGVARIHQCLVGGLMYLCGLYRLGLLLCQQLDGLLSDGLGKAGGVAIRRLQGAGQGTIQGVRAELHQTAIPLVQQFYHGTFLLHG